MREVTAIWNEYDFGNTIGLGFSVGEGSNRIRNASLLHDDNRPDEKNEMTLAEAKRLVKDPVRRQAYAEKLYELWCIEHPDRVPK